MDQRTDTMTVTAHKHLICWKSTFGGLAIALVTFIGALALAMAFGGIGLSDGATLKNAGTFTAVSLAIATIVASFAGAYYCVRMARFRGDMHGSAQGLLIGAILMAFVVFQVLSIAGTIGSAAAGALGSTASAVGSGVVSAAETPVAREMMEDAVGDLKLKSDIGTVAQGVSSRLMRGDQESAKNYLAWQAGITPAEADAKIAAAKAKLDEMTTKTREAAATALETTGWGLFLMICCALMASALGGLLGSVFNTSGTMELSDAERVTYRTKVRQTRA